MNTTAKNISKAYCLKSKRRDQILFRKDKVPMKQDFRVYKSLAEKTKIKHMILVHTLIEDFLIYYKMTFCENIPILNRFGLKPCRRLLKGSVSFALLFSIPFSTIFSYYNT